MTTSRHCNDNAADREVGARWERAFCVLAADNGRMFTPHQLPLDGKSASAFTRALDGSWSRYLLPDVTIWSAPGEHHELKHKNQTGDGCYGLEVYRLKSLIRFAEATGQTVYYTVHDWEIAGASSSRDDVPNIIEHWFAADVTVLAGRSTKGDWGFSYVGGERRRVEMRYWTASRYFRPLAEIWTPTTVLGEED